MAILKLTNAKSYHGMVHATEREPLVEVNDPSLVAYLLSQAPFTLVTEPEPAGNNPAPEPAGADEPEELPDGIIGDAPEPEPIPASEVLEAMTKAELIAYCEADGIDTTGCKHKSDYMAAISAWSGGSPTMVDLQRAPNYREEE